MSQVFGNPGAVKGCYRVVNVDTSSSRGSQLILPDGTDMPSSLADPFLITRVDINLQEDRFVSKNIGDVNFVYAFGHNASAANAVVSMIAIMHGKKDGEPASPAAVVPGILRRYTQNRIWAQEDPATLLMESEAAVSGFIDGLTSSTHEPFANLQAISFRLLIPQAP